ncbi:MAG TPA: 6-hydroxymethylpterin diphosphokinase MptE-like protein [Phycisphaerales bacterium]|nr:6-hydroxymethylpterin diphosphokinase MptE-like protein [Phycisphaerales bacterium]
MEHRDCLGLGVVPGLLERNLGALSRSSPETARLIASSAARGDARFMLGEDGALTGSIGEGEGTRWLASRRRALEEGARLAERVDPTEAGVVVVLGFGLGHHVRAIAEKIGRTGVTLVYEPDAALLRAVLGRIDYTEMFGACNVAVLTDAEDAGAMSAALRGAEVVVALGVRVVEHAPSGPRLGGGGGRFSEQFTRTVRAIRTNVVTTLMQTETSLRNGLMNLDWYASVPGIGDLTAIAHGRPAVVVSAGPSLWRNIGLLADPGVRERVVIIAAQTVLRPLLEAGIRPHFVTALDYHEISGRFYEGLTPEDVGGVTLVAEAKANPAILDAFPGAIRCPFDRTLTAALGAGFAHDGQAMEPGATVAHMAYTLARHMGCDPVILVGQDLGFTDGQYYAPRAAIHDVWAGELNEFNTLEAMEWQRVVRNRAHLHRATDHLGRPVYTDEQMSAYLVQFERMFAADAERGLATIDATEGGVSKRHAPAMPLADALAAFAPPGAGAAELPPTARSLDMRELCLPRVVDRLERLGGDVARVGEICRGARELLAEMLDHHGDQARVNGLIGRVYERGREARALTPAYDLVQHLNQTGQFKRFRADRTLHLEGGGTPLERQRREIERDITNMEWLAESAEQLGSLLASARDAHAGARPKLTRDPDERGLAGVGVRERARVAAVIAVDPERGGLGTRRALHRPVADGRNALQMTLARVASARGLDEIVLLAQDPDRVRAIAGEALPAHARIERVADHPLGERRHGVGAARAFAADCWRGGLCGMTVYDEAFDPATTLGVMERLKIDAAVIVGADWAVVDPGITEAVIERHREDPRHNRLAFTQAAPGLAPCVIGRSLVAELAASAARAGGFASVGGLLGYIPASPVMDPIAKPGCVRIDPELRDLGVRAIADSAWRCELLARATAGGRCGRPGFAAATRELAAGLALRGPEHLTLELCSGRRTGGELAQLLGDGAGADRASLAAASAFRLIEELVSARPEAAVTFGGVGDPLMHRQWREIVSGAKSCGVHTVHVRTDLQCGREEAIALLDCGADVVSVDLYAETAQTYRRLAGLASFERARENLVALLQERAAGGAMPRVWIVPRITRCDAVYGELESFYDRWLTVAQACVIDPLPRAVGGERIAPLPEPGLAAWRGAMRDLMVLSDGRAWVRERRGGGRGGVNALEMGLVGAWREVLRGRLDAGRSREPRKGRRVAAAA